jgi:allantoinase
VCGVSLHTFVVGQPFRLAHWRRALIEVMKHPDFGQVWVTTPGEIARYAASLPSGIVPGS